MTSAKKKKQPSTKAKKTKMPLSFFQSRELIALSFFATAVFFFVLDIFFKHTGLVGYWLYHAFGTLCGFSYFSLIWVYMSLAGLTCLFHRGRLLPLLSCLIASFFMLIVLLDGLFFSFSSHLEGSFYSSRTGYIGAAILWVCLPLFGTVGTFILLFAGQLMASVVLFGFSMVPIFRLCGKFLVYVQSMLMLNQKGFKKLCLLLFFTPKKPDNMQLRKKDILKGINNQLVPNPVLDNPVEEEPAVIEAQQFDFDDMHSDSENDITSNLTPKIETVQCVKKPTSFVLPSIELLKKPKKNHDRRQQSKTNQDQAKVLEEALASFNVEAKVLHITSGPSVTRFELAPGEGVKIARITALSKDIALKLAVPDVRIEAPIPGKALVGIEVPNVSVEMVTLRNIVDNKAFYANESRLLAAIGFTISGDTIYMDLAKMPHVLIAGATGSGKSVCINAIIVSILMRSAPDQVKFLMIDPKKVELSLYEGIPHLLSPVVTDPNKAAATLKKWALFEMERRYECFTKAGVKDIQGYNKWVSEQDSSALNEDQTPLTRLPYIVVVIDELADLMMVASQDVEQTICRLAQMSRATGIHLVIATQRPSVNVITGLIKANVPSRISFFLQSQIDSRTILDMGGAEKLLGKGDMLYSPVGSLKVLRAQGVYVSEDEVKGIVAWLKRQGSPDYVNELLTVEPLSSKDSNSRLNDSDDVDDLYEDAKQLIVSTRYASTSYLQRKLKIGYNRAARIMDQLEENGVIAEFVGERKVRSGIANQS